MLMPHFRMERWRTPSQQPKCSVHSCWEPHCVWLSPGESAPITASPSMMHAQVCAIGEIQTQHRAQVAGCVVATWHVSLLSAKL